VRRPAPRSNQEVDCFPALLIRIGNAHRLPDLSWRETKTCHLRKGCTAIRRPEGMLWDLWNANGISARVKQTRNKYYLGIINRKRFRDADRSQNGSLIKVY
jgi:hypothetical protein